MARVRTSDTDLALAVRRALFGLVLRAGGAIDATFPARLTWRLAQLA